MKTLTQADLLDTLHRLDGRGYKAYRDIQGGYAFSGFKLLIDHVQGDPYAPPSRVRLRVPAETAAFPEEYWQDPARRISLADYLTRAFGASLEAKGGRGETAVYRPGQKVLQRSTVRVEQGEVEVRFLVHLPAQGRRILGRRAARILGRSIPGVVPRALTWAGVDQEGLRRHVLSVEDQQALRSTLEAKGLVAFLADGSVLPRLSGASDLPLSREEGALPLTAPDPLAVTLSTPNSGPVRGLGLPRGVTLIVGGGFHGKSTLLKAIEQGIYDHLPGDGRERVVTLSTALKIRAEDGRAVTGVDISPFIDNLPGDLATKSFTTANGSGSTSQAAAIMEGLEAGANPLLIDEDTSATNFMIRDKRMQRLVAKDREPITPFLDRVRELYRDHGLSTVLVMGGCGDYFEAADTVIMMDSFEPGEVTSQAVALAREIPTGRQPEPAGPLTRPLPRRFSPSSFEARKGRREAFVSPRGLNRLLYGRGEVDLSGLEQLAEEGQTRALGLAVHCFGRGLAQETDLIPGLASVLEEAARTGLDSLSPWPVGDLALSRLLEAAQAVNRMRSLKLRT